MTDKQALREEFKMMQDCYSDPADRDRQVIYIAAEALLDEMEAKDRRIEEEIGRANREHHRGFMMACGHLKEHANVHYADAAEMEIAALRKRIAELRDWNAGLAQESCIQQQRIAELESRAVNLPKRSVGEVMHMSGFSRDYAEGWCSGNDSARHEIRAAGIGIKGESNNG